MVDIHTGAKADNDHQVQGAGFQPVGKALGVRQALGVDTGAAEASRTNLYVRSQHKASHAGGPQQGFVAGEGHG